MSAHVSRNTMEKIKAAPKVLKPTAEVLLSEEAVEEIFLKIKEETLLYSGDPGLQGVARFNHEMPNVRLGILETNSLLDMIIERNKQSRDILQEIKLHHESIKRSQDCFDARLNDIEAMLIKIRNLEREAKAVQGKLIQ